MMMMMTLMAMFAPASAKPSATPSVVLWVTVAVMAGLVVMRRKHPKPGKNTR